MAKDNSAVTVRRMTHDDQTRVNQIDRQLFGEHRVPTWPFSFETYWNIYGPGISFVAEINGEVVGFLAGTIVQQERSQSIIDMMHSATRSSRYPKIGYIDMIGISTEFQNKNVGRVLVNAFTEECKHNNAAVRAHIKESDERLSKFLTKMGFKKWETATFEKD